LAPVENGFLMQIQKQVLIVNEYGFTVLAKVNDTWF
jgi:hypothetical protein